MTAMHVHVHVHVHMYMYYKLTVTSVSTCTHIHCTCTCTCTPIHTYSYRYMYMYMYSTCTLIPFCVISHETVLNLTPLKDSLSLICDLRAFNCSPSSSLVDGDSGADDDCCPSTCSDWARDNLYIIR